MPCLNNGVSRLSYFNILTWPGCRTSRHHLASVQSAVWSDGAVLSIFIFPEFASYLICTLYTRWAATSLADGSTAGVVLACRDCSSVSSVPSFKLSRRLLRVSLRSFRRQHFRSASRRKLNIPRFRRSSYGTRAFLSRRPDGVELTARFLARTSLESGRFRRDLKTHHFAGHQTHQCIRGVIVSRNCAI